MNILIYFILLTLTAHNVVAQEMYTRQERDRILANHRRKLEKQTERIFQQDSSLTRSNSIYDTANYETIRDYEGQYAMVNLANQSHWTTICDKGFDNSEPLIGIDYKRHQSRHFLLCHSYHRLILKVFIIEDGFRITFRESTTLNYAGLQQIVQAIMFHNFQNGQLLIALHMRRSHISVLTTLRLHDMESGEFSLLESETVHQFEPFEHVVRIEVSHLMDSHKFVALLNSHPRIDYDRISKNLIRIQIPQASNLETFNIFTQTFIVASNATEFYILRVHPTRLERLAHLGHRGRIISIRPLVYGPNYYLFVAGERRQGIYQFIESSSTWKGRAVINKKNVRDAGLLSCSYQREDLFFWIDNGNEVFIYTFDYETRNFILKFSKKHNPIINNVQFISDKSCHFSEMNRAFEFKISNDGKLWLFGYEIILEGGGFTKRKPFWQLHNIVESKLSGLQRNIVKLKKTEIISKIDKDLNFNFTVKFNRKVIVRHLISHSSLPPNQWKINNISIPYNDILVDLNELKKFVKGDIHSHLNSIEHTLNRRVVYKSRGGTFLKTSEFIGKIKAPLIRVNVSSSIDIYNGFQVFDILSNLYRSSLNPSIFGRKHFTSDVIVTNKFYVGLLNQLSLDSYLFTDLEQDIYTPFWYSNLYANNIYTRGQINANLSLNNVIFVNQYQPPPIKIASRSMFEHLIVNDLHVNHMNNLDIRKLPYQVLKRYSNISQVFHIPTRFGTLNIDRSLQTNFLNGYSAQWLFSNLAFRSGENTFHAPIHIKNDMFLRTLQCPSINGIRIPLDLLDRFSNQIITGKKYFKSGKFNSVFASRVNSLRIPEDVYIATADEFISGKIVINSLNTRGHLHVNGLIDNVNMTHLDQRYISSLRNHYESLIFRRNVTAQNLHIAGLTDDFNLQEIYSDSIFIDSGNVEIFGSKQILSIFKTKNLRILGYINDVKLENFARTNEKLYFDSPVTFNLGQFRNVEIFENIDGIASYKFINSISSLRNNLPIRGLKSFKNLLQVDNLIIKNGKINNKNLNDFLLYTASQNITGRIHFSDVNFKRMQTISGINIKEKLNNENIYSFLSSIIFLDDISSLPMTIKCNNCSINDAYTNFVNGRNFSDFLQNYLSKTRSQIIFGEKRFLSEQKFFIINTTNGMADIDIKKINNQAITINGHNIINNEIILDNNLIVRSSGQLFCDYFNDRLFKKFLKQSVYINSTEKTIIRGSIQFDHGFHAQNHLYINRLNGILSNEMFFTKNYNHSINSEVIFHSNIHSGSKLQLIGSINGYNLKHLIHNTLKHDNNDRLIGNINFNGPINIDHIEVYGLVDEHLLNRNSILFKNSQQDISNMIINGRSYFLKETEILSSLNNYQSSIFDHIIYTSKNDNHNQVINSIKTFSSIQAPEIIHQNGYLYIPVINRKDIVHFERTAVYSLVNRTIVQMKHFQDNITFLNPIKIQSYFNGINLDNDIIKLESLHAQKITGHKIFERINLRESVDLYGEMNGLNLSSLNSILLQDHGHQHIKTNMIFHSPLYLEADSKVDYLNNVSPKNFITLSNDHQINGNITFEHATINHLKTKIINHVDINEVIPHLLYIKSNITQNVQGHLIVDNLIVEKDLETSEHINGIDLNVAVERATKNIHSSFNIVELRRNIEKKTNRIRSRAELFEYANFEIEHLSHSIVTDEQLKYAKFYRSEDVKYQFRVRDIFFECKLIEKSQNSKIYTIYIVQPNGIRVTFHQEPVVAHVSQVRSFVRQGYVYIVFGVFGQQHNSTQSWLKRIPVSRSNSNHPELVQIFDERDVTGLEFFADPYGSHYLVFNSLTNIGRSLRVYQANSIVNSRFEFIQSLPPLDAMTLFPFGHGSSFRQFYLAGIQEFDTFVLYRHDGIFGFKTKWTTRSPTLNSDSLSYPVVPLIVQKSKIYFQVYGCKSNIMIEAILNGALEDVQF